MSTPLPNDKAEVLQLLSDTTRGLGMTKPDPSKLRKYFQQRVPQRAFIDIFLCVQKASGFAAGLFEDRPELLSKGNEDKPELFARIATCVDTFQERPLGSWDIVLIANSGTSSATSEGVLQALQLLLAVALAGDECKTGGAECARRSSDAVAKGINRSPVDSADAAVASSSAASAAAASPSASPAAVLVSPPVKASFSSAASSSSASAASSSVATRPPSPGSDMASTATGREPAGRKTSGGRVASVTTEQLEQEHHGARSLEAQQGHGDAMHAHHDLAPPPEMPPSPSSPQKMGSSLLSMSTMSSIDEDGTTTRINIDDHEEILAQIATTHNNITTTTLLLNQTRKLLAREASVDQIVTRTQYFWAMLRVLPVVRRHLHHMCCSAHSFEVALADILSEYFAHIAFTENHADPNSVQALVDILNWETMVRMCARMSGCWLDNAQTAEVVVHVVREVGKAHIDLVVTPLFAAFIQKFMVGSMNFDVTVVPLSMSKLAAHAVAQRLLRSGNELTALLGQQYSTLESTIGILRPLFDEEDVSIPLVQVAQSVVRHVLNIATPQQGASAVLSKEIAKTMPRDTTFNVLIAFGSMRAVGASSDGNLAGFGAVLQIVVFNAFRIMRILQQKADAASLLRFFSSLFDRMEFSGMSNHELYHRVHQDFTQRIIEAPMFQQQNAQNSAFVLDVDETRRLLVTVGSELKPESLLYVIKPVISAFLLKKLTPFIKGGNREWTIMAIFTDAISEGLVNDIEGTVYMLSVPSSDWTADEMQKILQRLFARPKVVASTRSYFEQYRPVPIIEGALTQVIKWHLRDHWHLTFPNVVKRVSTEIINQASVEEMVMMIWYPRFIIDIAIRVHDKEDDVIAISRNSLSTMICNTLMQAPISEAPASSANARLDRPSYEVTFANKTLGIGLTCTMRGELPVVTKSLAALPLKGDVVTSVNGDSLEGLSDPFDEVMSRVKSLPRPIILGFKPNPDSSDKSLLETPSETSTPSSNIVKLASQIAKSIPEDAVASLIAYNSDRAVPLAISKACVEGSEEHGLVMDIALGFIRDKLLALIAADGDSQGKVAQKESVVGIFVEAMRRHCTVEDLVKVLPMSTNVPQMLQELAFLLMQVAGSAEVWQKLSAETFSSTVVPTMLNIVTSALDALGIDSIAATEISGAIPWIPILTRINNESTSVGKILDKETLSRLVVSVIIDMQRVDKFLPSVSRCLKQFIQNMVSSEESNVSPSSPGKRSRITDEGISKFADLTASSLVRDSEFTASLLLAADHAEMLSVGIFSAFKAVCAEQYDSFDSDTYAEEMALEIALCRLRRIFVAECLSTNDQKLLAQTIRKLFRTGSIRCADLFLTSDMLVLFRDVILPTSDVTEEVQYNTIRALLVEHLRVEIGRRIYKGDHDKAAMILQMVVPYAPYSFEDKLMFDSYLKTPYSAVQVALARLELLSGASSGLGLRAEAFESGSSLQPIEVAVKEPKAVGDGQLKNWKFFVQFRFLPLAKSVVTVMAIYRMSSTRLILSGLSAAFFAVPFVVLWCMVSDLHERATDMWVKEIALPLKVGHAHPAHQIFSGQDDRASRREEQLLVFPAMRLFLTLNKAVVPVRLYPLAGWIFRLAVVSVLFFVHDLPVYWIGNALRTSSSIAQLIGESAAFASVSKSGMGFISLLGGLLAFIVMDLPLVGFWIIQAIVRGGQSLGIMLTSGNAEVRQHMRLQFYRLVVGNKLSESSLSWDEDVPRRLQRAHQRSSSVVRAMQCWCALLTLPYGFFRVLYLEFAPLVLEPFRTASPEFSGYEAKRSTLQVIEAVPQVIIQLVFLSRASSIDAWVLTSVLVCIIQAYSSQIIHSFQAYGSSLVFFVRYRCLPLVKSALTVAVISRMSGSRSLLAGLSATFFTLPFVALWCMVSDLHEGVRDVWTSQMAIPVKVDQTHPMRNIFTKRNGEVDKHQLLVYPAMRMFVNWTKVDFPGRTPVRMVVLLVLFVVHDVPVYWIGNALRLSSSVAQAIGESAVTASTSDSLGNEVAALVQGLVALLVMDLPLIGFWIIHSALRVSVGPFLGWQRISCSSDSAMSWDEDVVRRMRRARQRSRDVVRAMRCWWAVLTLPYGVFRVMYLEFAPMVFEPFHVSSPRHSSYEASRSALHLIEIIPQVIIQLMFLSKASSIDLLVLVSVLVCCVYFCSTYQLITEVKESYPRSTRSIFKELLVAARTEKVIKRPYALELRMEAAIDFERVPPEDGIAGAFFVEISNCLAWSQNLLSLRFAADQMSTENLRFLCAGLQGNTKLKKLTVSQRHSTVTKPMPYSLPAQLSATLGSLEYLALEGMNAIAPDELLELASAVKSKGTLHTLRLSCVAAEVGEGGAKTDGSWDWLYQPMGPRVLATAHCLREVAFCSIDDSLCIDALVAGLRMSPSITSAEFSGSRFSLDATNQLAQWVQHNSPLDQLTVIGLKTANDTARAAQRALSMLIRAIGDRSSGVSCAVLSAHDGGFVDDSFMELYTRTVQTEGMNAIHARKSIHTLVVGFTLSDPWSQTNATGMVEGDLESGLERSSPSRVGRAGGSSAESFREKSNSTPALRALRQLQRFLGFPIFVGLNNARPSRVKEVLQLVMSKEAALELRGGLALALDRCVLTSTTLQSALGMVWKARYPIRWLSLRHNPLCTSSLQALCALVPHSKPSQSIALSCHVPPSRVLEKLDLMGVDIDVEALRSLAAAVEAVPEFEVLLSTTHLESPGDNHKAIDPHFGSADDDQTSEFAGHLASQIQSKDDTLFLSTDDWLYRISSIPQRDIAVLGDLLMHSTKLFISIKGGGSLNLDALRTQCDAWWRPIDMRGTNALELYLYSTGLSGLVTVQYYEGAVPADAFSMLAAARQVDMTGAKNIEGPITAYGMEAIARVRSRTGESDAWKLQNCSPLGLVSSLRSSRTLTSVNLRSMDTLDFTLQVFLSLPQVDELLLGGCRRLSGMLTAPLIKLVTDIRRKHGLDAVDLRGCGPFSISAALSGLVDADLRSVGTLIMQDFSSFETCGSSLKSLMLDDCPNVAGNVGELVQKCEKLNVLGFSNTGASISLDVASRARPHFQVVRFGSCEGFSGSIDALPNWTSLKYFDVRSTLASGQLAGLGPLTNLRFLNVSDTNVTGSLKDLGNSCLRLEEIHIERTKVKGRLRDLQPLKHLRVARLTASKVTGRLSDLDHFVSNLGCLAIDETQVDFAEHVDGFTEAHPICVLVTGV